MKKIIKIFSLLMVMLFTFIPAIHANNVTYVYQSDNVEIIITHSNLNQEKLLYIAQMLESGEINTEIQTYGLTCTLFGHKLTNVKSEVITHMVYNTYPHCKREYYNVDTCERCDYTTTELISTEKVGCCVE